jgi:mannose-6-phosphate isomerase-like protein (cupin superfamily)
MRAVILGLFLASAVSISAQAPVPAPSTYLSDAELMATLKETAKTAPDMHTAPVKNTDHYRINVVQRTKPQGAITHPGFIEVHHIIEGTGTLVTGGRIVRAAGAGAGAATIEGGESRHVAKGDVVLIPAGAPHWYKDFAGTLTYLEVRFEEVK